MKTTGSAVLLLLIAPILAVADDSPKPGTFNSILDTSVPHSAAQTLLGLDPSKVDSPTTLSSKAFSILQGFGSGTVGQGLSFSMSFQEIVGRKITFDDWRKNSLSTRLQNFTQVSFGLVAGDGKTSPAKAAFGIAIPFKDQTDWRLHTDAVAKYVEASQAIIGLLDNSVPMYDDWPSGSSFDQLKTRIATVKKLDVDIDAYNTAVSQVTDDVKSSKEAAEYLKASNDYLVALGAIKKAAFTASQPVVPNDPQDGDFAEAYNKFKAYRKAYKLLYDDIVKVTVSKSKVKDFSSDFETQASAYYWNREKINLAVAASWGSADNTYSGMTGTGSKLWFTITEPLNEKNFSFVDPEKFEFPNQASITFHAALTSNEKAYANQSFGSGKNGIELGARIKSGSSKSSLFCEALYKNNGPTGSRTSAASWTLGVEQRLQKTQWLQLSIGSDPMQAKNIIFGLGYSLNTSTSRAMDITGNN